jgi:hypothetical protein
MNKVLGVLSILLGLAVGIYNHLFRAANVTKSAVMQLEDSDVTYGLGAGLANSNSGLILSVVALALIAYGIYRYFKKSIKKCCEEK